jgi:CDP-diacylglycerol---glycerol-3-phosphate 3-phosphatidyltransferase
MVLPNQLTVLRIILSPIFFVLFISNNQTLMQISIGVFIIAALSDWYDGWLARKFNYITDWGKFWDPLADKILTAFAFAGLIILGIVNVWMVVIILLRDFVVTILRAFADYKKVSFSTSKYAKWKTFIQMIFLYYLLLVYVASKSDFIAKGRENLFALLLDQKFIFYSILIITLITVHSGFLYLYQNRHLIKKLLRG